MKMLIIFLIVIAAMAALVAFIRRQKAKENETGTWPFYEKKPLTEPEQILYHRLVSAMPECIILAQVQLSRVLGVKKGFNFHEWNNRINRMSVDFLVCLKDSTIVAAIELDDKTHEKPSRIKDDEKKNRALASAGIALIRWNVSSMPNETAIRQALT